jgi:DNA mismatch repair protein MutL
MDSIAAALNTIIQRLPPDVVARIAAGEVVERPASVVKELVENALDAGATQLSIDVAEGGQWLRVADNGKGMRAEDLPLAFENHATSKLVRADDLENIATLGFRGEALASIAAVSRVTCQTRPTPPEVDFPQGLQVRLDAGVLGPLSPAGCAPGTVMEVADLFFNVPARWKFLKRPSTEVGYVQEAVEALALSRPGVGVSLTIEQRAAFQVPPGQSLRQTLVSVCQLPAREMETLTTIDLRDDVWHATGWITQPEVQKRSRRWLWLFVNGRSVKCPVFHKALEAALADMMPTGTHPVCVVHLSLPPSFVDVNVHPAKREVRYHRPNLVFSFLRQAVRNSLEGATPTWGLPLPTPSAVLSPSFDLDPDFSPRPDQHWPQTHAQQTALALSPWAQPPFAANDAKMALPPLGPDANHGETLRIPEITSLLPAAASAGGRAPQVIGQLFNTYILLETVQGLMVVDQHIASERAWFEKLSRQILAPVAAGQAPRQHLLTSEVLPLSAEARGQLDAVRDTLAQWGFAWRLEEAGVVLRAVPVVYASRPPQEVFSWLLASLSPPEDAAASAGAATSAPPPAPIDHLVATLACHSAVRAGDVLRTEDMEAVIAEWLACRLPWTCPHGRPIAHTIRRDELQRFFHRQSLPVGVVTTSSGV